MLNANWWNASARTFFSAVQRFAALERIKKLRRMQAELDEIRQELRETSRIVTWSISRVEKVMIVNFLHFKGKTKNVILLTIATPAVPFYITGAS